MLPSLSPTVQPATLVVLIALGLLTGHVARRSAPWLLGARDRPLPFRWPWVELLGAALFALVGLRLGAGLGTLPAYVLIALLLGVIAADQRYKLIPDALTLGGGLVGVLLGAALPFLLPMLASQGETIALVGVPVHRLHITGFVLAAGGALVGFVLLETMRLGFSHLAGFEVMGMGDSKLMLMLGAFLGPIAVVLALPVACVIGLLTGFVHRLRTGQPHFPFGPALAGGGVVVLLADDAVRAALLAPGEAIARLSPLAVLAVMGVLIGLLIAVMLRLRARAAAYAADIDADYAQAVAELEDGAPAARDD
ncbi:MAG: A24 family peptidase [Acidobacteriota bacterium]